jgi:amidase
MNTDELIYASATVLAQAIRSKKVSAVEVVNAYLQRIEEVNPTLNAVVQLTADAARAQAREADAAQARGEGKGPLHGVPITIKDMIETAGVICTSGTKGRASCVPPRDATIVARMHAAGAIILGKTNTPELGVAPETDNLVYGRTNNPYDLSRTPGGSSGGEGAITAAGGSPLGLGSDGGGSIRIPAHCCGIVGIKPTSGRVPRTGHFPGPGGPMDSLWQVGPRPGS